jgi:probable F420-dependent oxidoreductase
MTPRLVLILSENWSLVGPHELGALIDMAVEAEVAGFDGVMVSEHVVLGRGADANGVPANPREYALPGNQDPATPWPDPFALLAAVAARTTRLRLIASAVIAPLRHPLGLAKQIATLDVLSGGRLVVQPTVSWHRPEYEALGVPFDRRGDLLDEHLAVWRRVWAGSPSRFEGAFYRFEDVFVEPRPTRAAGPPLWFGGERLHDRLLDRLVRYGSGFNPLGSPTDSELGRLRDALLAAGLDLDAMEMVGGTRGRFPDATSTADLDEALSTIPGQLERGFGTICVKPSQFLDDASEVPAFCRRAVERVGQITSK